MLLPHIIIKYVWDISLSTIIIILIHYFINLQFLKKIYLKNKQKKLNK